MDEQQGVPQDIKNVVERVVATVSERVVSAQGVKAVSNGNFLELIVETQLKMKKYIELEEKIRYALNKSSSVSEFIDACAGLPSYGKQLKLIKSIYGESFRIDFSIYHPVKWPNGLLIETKYQQVSGSVDEKLPFSLLTMTQVDVPTVIIAAGRGFRQSALAWLDAEANRIRLTTKSDIVVFTNTDEAIKWLNNKI